MNDLLKVLEQHITVDDTTLDAVTCLCGEEWDISTHIDPPREWARHVIEKLVESPIQLGFSVQYGDCEGHGHVSRVNAHLINPKNYRKAGPLIGFADLVDEASTSLALAIMSAASMADSKDEKR